MHHLLKEMALPQLTGWDYLAIDAASRRLFISNNSGIVVLNIDSFQVEGTVPSPPTYRGVGLVHGVAIATPLNRGFISHEVPPSIVWFDLKTLAVRGSAPTDAGTDAIVYEPVTQRVFAFNGKHRGVHNATVIEATTGQGLGNLALPGVPEFAVADDAGHLYVNVASQSRLGRIDAKSLKLTDTWPMAPCEEPSGLAIDAVHAVLFAACDNRILAMIDASSGKVLATVASGVGTDAVAFDPGTEDVFASNGEGTLTRAHKDSPKALRLIEQVKTRPSARTLALDTSTHRVFLMAAVFGEPPAHPTPENPHGYPVALAGTAKLLVFGP
jgi:DNA-binding beta-propeller fold protein YncE